MRQDSTGLSIGCSRTTTSADVLRISRRTLDASANVEPDRKRLRDSSASHSSRERRAVPRHRPPLGLQADHGGGTKLETTARTKSVARGRQRRKVPQRHRSRKRRNVRFLIHAVTENSSFSSLDARPRHGRSASGLRRILPAPGAARGGLNAPVALKSILRHQIANKSRPCRVR